MKVAIAGGGIGGLMAALALTREDIDVVVFEQAPSLAAIGASLQLGPNALRLAGDLGLLPTLREIGVRPDAVQLLRWDDGSLLLDTEMGDAVEQQLGAPQLDFYRPQLHATLAAALAAEVLQLGRRVDSVAQDAHGVTVSLSDGGRERADVAVAADGIRSPIRQQLFGAERPEFSGTVVYRGAAPRSRAEALHRGQINRYWLGPQRHGVSYWVSRGALLAVNCAVQDVEWSQESWTLEARSAEALPYFDGWDESLRARIAACDQMLRGAVFVRRPLAHWSAGRVTLVGDAAHAMEPFQAQGAAQAVEDAYVLAQCLARDPDPTAALLAYERIRLGRAGELQSSSAQAANVFYLPDGEAQRARDAAYATLAERQPFGPRQPIWEYDVRDAVRDAYASARTTTLPAT
ncbi:MAG: FAD-dependent monooxygenase [Solirubrobacteraceae bacterium]